jgi:hypothetical protein
MHQDSTHSPRILLQVIYRRELLQGGTPWHSGHLHSGPHNKPVLQAGFDSGEDMLRQQVSTQQVKSESATRLSWSRTSRLFHTLCTIRSKLPTTRLVHEWVKAHMDRTVPWDCLTLEQQLNKTCNKLANCAVTRARSRAGAEKQTTLLLPFEGAAILVGGIKITSNIAPSVHHILSREEARKFYTKAREVTTGTNKGGLGWSQATFDAVDWSAIAAALRGKPEMFGLWLSKQSIGVCATRKNLGRIQDILDD